MKCLGKFERWLFGHLAKMCGAHVLLAEFKLMNFFRVFRLTKAFQSA